MPAYGSNVPDVSIVFFGTEEFSLVALEALVNAGYHVALVVTKPDSLSGRGMKRRSSPVKEFALNKRIDVIQPDRIPEADAAITATPKRVGVLSSYGKIIPQSTLNLFDHGIINIHPSLLPNYRGPSPIETALINGDEHTGVSLMKLAPSMDAGPVYVQQSVVIDSDTDATELYETCARLGSSLLIDSLERILSGELKPAPQDDSLASYTQLLNKTMSRVDPERQTAEEIERHVRAYIEYPRTRLTIQDHYVIITAASLDMSESDILPLDCANGTRLAIRELVAPSGKRMSGADFSRGYLTK